MITCSTSSAVALASSQTISARGIIIEPTWRSSRRNTLRTIWCSWASMTPASRPSSRLAAISSSVTLRSGPPRTPNSRSVASVHHESSLTNGRAISDSHSIGRATRRATVSGYIRPSRLGTSSPKMMVRKVIVTTTIAVAVISAARSPMRKVACSQCANGAENAASPTMPLRMPIEVMPICTTDRNLVGLSCSSSAWLRARIARLEHHLQPRLAARGERHLGHGEEPIQDDQEKEERNVHAAGAGVGGSQRSRIAPWTI